MIITVIHGQSHKGTTYHITKAVLDGIRDEESQVYEFFLPKDGPNFCVGCANCFLKGEEYCPDFEKVKPIAHAIEVADVIILDSPTYGLEMSGPMKSMLDHLCYMWISHRPRPSIYNKVGITISSTAGAGAKGVAKSLKRQLFWMGVPTVFIYGQRVMATGWNDVDEDTKQKINIKASKIINKVKRNIGKVKPKYYQRFLFLLMRLSQKKNTWNPIDRKWWEENGWLKKSRPWK